MEELKRSANYSEETNISKSRLLTLVWLKSPEKKVLVPEPRSGPPRRNWNKRELWPQRTVFHREPESKGSCRHYWSLKGKGWKRMPSLLLSCHPLVSHQCFLLAETRWHPNDKGAFEELCHP